MVITIYHPGVTFSSVCMHVYQHGRLFVKDHVYLYMVIYVSVCIRMHKMYVLMWMSCETIERMNLGQAAKQPRITVFKGRIVAICRHNRNINLQYTALTATQIVASNNNYLLSVRDERHLSSIVKLLWDIQVLGFTYL